MPEGKIYTVQKSSLVSTQKLELIITQGKSIRVSELKKCNSSTSLQMREIKSWEFQEIPYHFSITSYSVMDFLKF